MSGDLLTEAEHELVRLLGEAYNAFCRVVGDGPTRDHDLDEIAALIHGLQHKVMAQAAARAYPWTRTGCSAECPEGSNPRPCHRAS